MIEARQGQRFIAEAPAGFGIGKQAGREDFQGDVTLQARVAGTIDHAHSACSELSENEIVAETLTDHFGTGTPRIGILESALQASQTCSASLCASTKASRLAWLSP